MKKTNVIRSLDQKKIPYTLFQLENAQGLSGSEVARAQNQDIERVFKTLVTVGKSGKHYVYMVPVDEELDLKKAAKVAGEKSIEMIKSKELLSLTGYVHGGCSPIGMKKQFPTFIDSCAEKYEKIYFSAGEIGMQIEVRFDDFRKVIEVKLEDIII